ncbi:exo-alpha-sialidase [Thalassotalea atypica]|uniref:exo-alpha-sialidase n=1 Tax=Thalassotalea atypica TaxID=2054316 RepID=UPI0025747D7E|nr:exo-alpha-sialidase [Thalassotalea atypica]
MRRIVKACGVLLTSCSFIWSTAYADIVIVSYDASASTAPTVQGWTDFSNQQAQGTLVQDLGSESWKADGTSGRAQWSYVPSSQNNIEATTSGWKMTWTSRIASGAYITDYYSNGSLRFLPILSVNAAGDLMVSLEGGGNHTLVSGTGSDAYHDYAVEFDASTNLATFSFDGVVIDSAWSGSSSGQNIIAWGNGSTGIDGIAHYKNISFEILTPAALSPLAQWDTSSLTFDGNGQYSAVDGDLPLVENLAQGSIYTHFKASGTTATLFSVSDSSNDSSEFALVINGDGTLRVHARNNGSFVNDSKTITTYNDNQEHKALIMVNSEGTKIYVDGSLAFTSADTSFINTVSSLNSMNIGRNYDLNGGQWYFNGNIYDTRVYANVMTNDQAEDLTTLSTIVASFDSAIDTDPVNVGWINDSADSGSGSIVTDQGQPAWQANGTGGRAEWEVTPSLQVNTDAANLGWKMTTTSRVVSGSSITDYYANGLQRFLISLSINGNGDLVANLEGGSSHTLVSTTGADQYHTYETSFDVATGLATFSFDGTDIETWSGSASSQNVIVWGNGSSGTNGIANYREVSFETFGTGPAIFESIVFQGGQEGVDGTSNYRIPAMVQSGDGTLLAFIEGRPSGADPGQAGQINISLKRSIDNGRNWLPVQVLHEDSAYDYSDPRPFVDKATNTVYVFYVQWPDLCAQNGNCVGPEDDNFLFYRASTDNGVTWGAPVDVTSQVKDPTWRSINPGPGQGIQLQWQTTGQGNNNGRMIFPAIIRAGNSNFYVATIFSDDGGITWEKGSFTPVSGPTEADMVELTDGSLLLSARNDGGASGTRYHFLSTDGGETWVQTTHDLAVSKVDLGMTRYSAVRSGDSENRILVSGPMGTSSGPNRSNLAIWSSFDEGVSFGTPHQLVYGFTAYSDIIKLDDGSIGIIYEATGNTLLKFMNFELSEIQ